MVIRIIALLFGFLDMFKELSVSDELDQDDGFVFLERSSKELYNELKRKPKTGLLAHVLKTIVAQYAGRPDFTAIDEDLFSYTTFKPFFNTIVGRIPYCSRDGRFTQLGKSLQP
ncbi:hypothetical protein O0I10_011785 [Lichtheimia ornata]|uniref:Uncharacterized protein n=1 Tax=Lichtheimia ornata TaxID=688661 RepID=A0AAD7XSC1_9FUNG|nr:uncharacterized protein O0I10_011785 [Lichtheimia ornata]KAJ8652580.1 hypothetical protein O0I10_011785 [Lichtheimia ornata]